jgi:hypothetical protein
MVYCQGIKSKKKLSLLKKEMPDVAYLDTIKRREPTKIFPGIRGSVVPGRVNQKSYAWPMHRQVTEVYGPKNVNASTNFSTQNMPRVPNLVERSSDPRLASLASIVPPNARDMRIVLSVFPEEGVVDMPKWSPLDLVNYSRAKSSPFPEQTAKLISQMTQPAQ